MEKRNRKVRIITVAGRPGSGKSTATKEVAARLGYMHFSSGDLFRAVARQKGIDVLQANLTSEENKELDELVDGRLRDIGANDERLVIDSRLAWHWIPQSYKVFLDLDLAVAARRVLANIDQARMESEHIPNDEAEYTQQLKKRLESEARRYQAVYSVNPFDFSQYDLIIDTGKNPVEDVVSQIEHGYRGWLGETSV